jgi:uncharacterized protein (DUF1330 family)
VTTPPAYLIANIEEVTDKAMLAQYGAAVPETGAAFGGHVIVRGSTPVMLDRRPFKDALLLRRSPIYAKPQNAQLWYRIVND